MTEQNKHLAVQANINSMHHATNKDKDAWLGLFAEDAIVRDPVGISPLDPEGNGHIGKGKIEAFWDNVIANGNVKLTATKRWTSGDYHCAVAIEGRNDMVFVETFIEMLVVYEVNEAGKIKSLSAHWNFDDLMAQIKAAQSK